MNLNHFPTSRFIRELVLLMSAVILPTTAQAALGLEQYLEQVRSNNSGFRATQEQKQGADLRKEEGNLQTAWTLIGSATAVNDHKLPQNPLGVYGSLWSQNYQIGLSKQWSFGPLTKLTYNWQGTTFINPTRTTANFGFGPVVIGPIDYFNAFPQLDISIPLIANGWGFSVRAGQTLAEASALAASFGASFQSKALLSSAEAAYWRLSVSRQLVKIARATFSRTQKIFEWNQRRVRMQLADRGEMLQTQAALQQSKFAVQSAEDDVRTASRAFNSARNIDSVEVPEELDSIDTQLVDKLSVPTRVALRDDVKAAQQSARITQAQADLSVEKNKPSFNLIGSLALNGQQQGTVWPSDFLDSMRNSFTVNRPTYTVGLQLNMPLNFLSGADARDGYRKEAIAADLNYSRKVFEQEQTWAELNQRFTESKTRLTIARELETVQNEKLEHERDRYDRGRTTTFQLLSFETDFLNSQVQRLRSELEVISTVAQMKLFTDSEAKAEANQ